MSTLPLVMVAPNGARRGKADHPALPVTIPEIVETARACHAAGAGGIHAHVRDRNGVHVLDAGLYRELLAEMARNVPEMQVQITTESAGRFEPPQQRALVADVLPRAVSVSLREMLADDDMPATRRFYHDCAGAGIAVQHILYDLSDIDRFARLTGDGTIPREQIQALIVLGRYSDGQVAQVSDLDDPLAALCAAAPDADWAVCAFGPLETACLIAAHRQGGKMRVGFENNLINSDGRIARDNAERVREVLSLIETASGP